VGITTVNKEPTVPGYLQGQTWNRPVEDEITKFIAFKATLRDNPGWNLGSLGQSLQTLLTTDPATGYTPGLGSVMTNLGGGGTKYNYNDSFFGEPSIFDAFLGETYQGKDGIDADNTTWVVRTSFDLLKAAKIAYLTKYLYVVCDININLIVPTGDPFPPVPTSRFVITVQQTNKEPLVSTLTPTFGGYIAEMSDYLTRAKIPRLKAFPPPWSLFRDAGVPNGFVDTIIASTAIVIEYTIATKSAKVL
jgi:hypothetical protein